MNATTRKNQRPPNYERVARRFWPKAYRIWLVGGADVDKACWAVWEGCPPPTIKLYEDRAAAERHCRPGANCLCDSGCSPYMHQLYDLRSNPPRQVDLSVPKEPNGTM